MSLLVFIDYDNLLEHQKCSGILTVVTNALIQMPLDSVPQRATCDIRIYGGWYEGSQMTPLAQNVAVSIQSDFPAIIRLPRITEAGIALTANAELAFALLEEPGHHLFNTYRKKGRPGNIRIQSAASVGCKDPQCPLPLLRQIIKSGKCPKMTCNVKDDLLYRHEQKLVDTMLACDLVFASQMGCDHVILISGDDDFLPPVRTALLRGTNVARFHPRPNSQRTPIPVVGGQFSERDL